MAKKVIAYTHFHWDREWYKEYEKFRFRLLKCFDIVLDLLQQNKIPSFYFDGQTSALLDYLEIYPHKKELIKSLVKDNRLFIGPFYCLIDEFLTSKPAFTKNLEIGLETAHKFGCDNFIAYFADTFGHSACTIPVLNKFGIDKAMVWRGCGNIPAEFTWQYCHHEGAPSPLTPLPQGQEEDNYRHYEEHSDEAIQKTEILKQVQNDTQKYVTLNSFQGLSEKQILNQVQNDKYCHPEFISGSTSSHQLKTVNLIRGYFQDVFSTNWDINKKTEFLKSNLDKIAEKSGNTLLLPIGADHLATPLDLDNQIKLVNEQLEDYEIILGSPFDYFNEVNDRFSQYTHVGELRDNSKTFILEGCYSSRLDIKRWNIIATQKLETAEALINHCENKEILRYAQNDENEILKQVQNDTQKSVTLNSFQGLSEKQILKQVQNDNYSEGAPSPLTPLPQGRGEENLCHCEEHCDEAIQNYTQQDRTATPSARSDNYRHSERSEESPYKNLINHAYKLLLQNQAHDSICGCSTDDVHEENITRYKKIIQIADSIIENFKIEYKKEHDIKDFKIINLDNYQGEYVFDSEKVLPYQIITTKKGFPTDIFYDINKIPITEDYTNIYTYKILKQVQNDNYSEGAPSPLTPLPQGRGEENHRHCEEAIQKTEILKQVQNDTQKSVTLNSFQGLSEKQILNQVQNDNNSDVFVSNNALGNSKTILQIKNNALFIGEHEIKLIDFIDLGDSYNCGLKADDKGLFANLVSAKVAFEHPTSCGLKLEYELKTVSQEEILRYAQNDENEILKQVQNDTQKSVTLNSFQGLSEKQILKQVQNDNYSEGAPSPLTPLTQGRGEENSRHYEEHSDEAIQNYTQQDWTVTLSAFSDKQTTTQNEKIFILATLNSQDDKIKFDINWENTHKNHYLQFSIDTQKPIHETLSEDLNSIIKREFNPDYNPREHLPQTKGIEVMLNNAPMQRGVSANNLTVVTQGITQYEVAKTELRLPLLRATGVISNPQNPSRTTPAGPPIETPALQQLGHNSQTLWIALGCDLKTAINEVYHKYIVV